jgi:putative membrane protein
VGRFFVISWAFNTIALLVATWLLPGVSYDDSWWALLLAGIVFTAVNMWVKPVIAILSLPFIVVTLGLFYFLINILMLYLTDWLVADFDIDGFGWAILAAIIVSAVNGILHAFLGDPRDLARPEPVS